MDEEERYELGSFDSLAAAIAACKEIVDEFLLAGFKPGMNAEELYSSYMSFGEDPFIVGGEQPRPFSAWDYAKERSQEICGTRCSGVPLNRVIVSLMTAM